MNRIILLLVSAYFLVSCRHENSKNPIRKQIAKSSSLTKDGLRNKNKPEDEMLNQLKEKYSNVYVFELGSNDEAEGKEIQYLAINYLENKNIDFYLYTETLPCDTEYWGIAENKNWNRDGEIDEDEEGAYFVNEYIKEEKKYSIGIRLAEDLSKVQIKYLQKDSLETDCLPITEQIMKRIK